MSAEYILKYVSYILPEKKDLTFHAQFAWNVKSYFLAKIRETSSIRRLLDLPIAW